MTHPAQSTHPSLLTLTQPNPLYPFHPTPTTHAPPPVGCVTRDGEHPSDHGSSIMAKMFAQEAIKWFYKALTK